MDHNFTKLIGDWLNKTEEMRDTSCAKEGRTSVLCVAKRQADNVVDTLYIGCEKFPQHSTSGYNNGGVL